MHRRFHLYIFFTMFCIRSFLVFYHYAYLISNCCFSTLQKVITGVGWLVDLHGPSSILCDTAPSLFTLISYCWYSAFICSSVGEWLVYFMRWLLWCFCLLAESYEKKPLPLPTMQPISRVNHRQVISMVAGYFLVSLICPELLSFSCAHLSRSRLIVFE